MSEERKSQQEHADEQVEDLAVGQEEAEDVKGGGRKAGGDQQEYLEVKLENVQITSYQL
jgi:hypothetical protein